jgi:selT/selW/selH-like putative selenoprotein
LAEEIENRLGFKPKLIAGSGGVFDVRANDELIFSKHEVDRFPDPDEVFELLKRIASR